MSNFVDENGLTTQTLDEITTEITEGLKGVYGQDINVNPNSPDAQQINIYAQSKIDQLDLSRDVYNSFSPTLAQGRVLDERCAINGVKRQGATRTTVEVDITTDRNVTLQGINQSTSPFTVADTTGNNFVLVDTVSLETGLFTLLFQAQDEGAVEVQIGTITEIVTITLGVLSANNPNNAITQGVDQETDFQLRERRKKSVSLPSQGYLEGILAALLTVDDVTDAQVFENNTSATDSNGIPPHSLWCIVENGLNDDIARQIYIKRSAGSGMKGDVQVGIPQSNGFDFQVFFDRPENVDLYIKATINSIDPAHQIDAAYLKQYLFDNLSYKINESCDFSQIVCILKEADPQAVITIGATGGVSIDDADYFEFLDAPTLDSKFILSTARMDFTVP